MLTAAGMCIQYSIVFIIGSERSVAAKWRNVADKVFVMVVILLSNNGVA